MFPQNVAHEWWRPTQEVCLWQGTKVAPADAEIVDRHALKAKLFDSPQHPGYHLTFCPTGRIFWYSKALLFLLKATETLSEAGVH